MTTWLFDLGNTRLKFARLQPDGSPGETVAIVHDDRGDWLQALPRGEVALIASVASQARRVALVEALRAAGFVRLHGVHTQGRLGRLRIAYAQPRHLGVDRFLTLLAALDAGPVMLVGVGTALTCDLLDAQGVHRGGRIAPSPALMREALRARTSMLPEHGGVSADFADDTVHALASGCDGAALALFERSLDAGERLLGSRPALWLHGGGAEALRSRLPAHVWTADAVLRGLARWHAQCIA